MTLLSLLNSTSNWGGGEGQGHDSFESIKQYLKLGGGGGGAGT